MSPDKTKASPPKSGEPTVAVLLTWFVPGLGHAYLGRLRTAAIAFVVVEGLYLLGMFFSEGRFLEYLPPEMRSRFAGMLSPEVGNLGALLFHTSRFGYGDGAPAPWSATMDLGTVLTAASGIANVFVMSSAHFAARSKARMIELRERPVGAGSPKAVAPRPAAAALMTWLVPGLGHWMQGRRGRGVLAFGMLVGLFAIATFLCEGANLDRERHFYYWSGQFLLGLPAVVAEFVHGHPLLTHEVVYHDAGIVLGCVAGLLNVLLMLDVYLFAEMQWTSGERTDERAPQRVHSSPNPPPGYAASREGADA